MSHKCAAEGCDKCVSDAMLMCAVHWRQVPEVVQHAVRRTWRAVQRSNSTTYFVKLASYRQSCSRAVACVKERAVA